MRAVSTPELLAENIRQAISHGEFAPGEALHQEHLAERFGVSRSPVREALRLLEARGLVTYQSNRGATVNVLTAGDVEEMYEVRRLLEGALIRHSTAFMDAATTDRARILLDSIRREPDPHTWLRLHWTFHHTLYTPAKRPRMLDVVYQQHVRISDSPHASETVTSARRSFIAHDRELLRALDARDADAAVLATFAHLDDTRAKLLAIIPGETI